jgi:ribose-phosphate pyrophosphokinase
VREIAVFGGSAHPELAAEICDHLEVPLRPVRVTRFANDCLEVQLQANCRERDVFLIQPLVTPVQENLVELLLMLDAPRARPSSCRTTPTHDRTRRTHRASRSAAGWSPTCLSPPGRAGCSR